MSVKSRIAIKQKDNTYKSIYCHNDGDLFGNGKTLYEYYRDPIKIELLMTLGDLSSLKEYLSPDALKKHDFDNPLCDVCVAYHRDRGEKLNIQIDNDLDSLLRNVSSSDQDYLYIYEDGRWEYTKTISNDFESINFEDLEQTLYEYDIIDHPSSYIELYVDELANELLNYTKDSDPYEYKDLYSNDDDAFNSIKKSLCSVSDVDSTIEWLCADIQHYASESDLSNNDILDYFKTANHLLIELNSYSKVLEKQKDNEMDM